MYIELFLSLTTIIILTIFSFEIIKQLQKIATTLDKLADEKTVAKEKTKTTPSKTKSDEK